MSRSPYVVGIDLGTTNTAVAAAESRKGPESIEIFPVPQLVREAEMAERPILPSAVYLSSGRDLPAGALCLPWDNGPGYAVGEFARIQGVRQPGRLVVSSKSWLCHGGVDREARILPWGGAEDCDKISPVVASSLILRHVREAWDSVHPQAPLASQEVVITVPASFDEYARRLTTEAAEQAGLRRFTLIEEPQAALYAWIWASGEGWGEELEGVERVVVVDVGGGTTDFALVAVHRAKAGLRLERLAVGDHLLLGGDNMDIALARGVEERICGGAGRLDSARWQVLAARCREAKELLLSQDPPAQIRIEIPGAGRSVVGGVVAGTLRLEEARRVVIDGFFPPVPGDAPLRQQAGAGLREWGLPFAEEPEITRHLAAFLRRHAGTAGQGAAPPRPDAVLFNGGVMIPEEVRSRVVETIGEWFGSRPPRALAGVDLNLAVARGAAYYGLARQGLGVRISGGSGRSYYVGLDQPGREGEPRLLCLVARGMEEGEERRIAEPEFEILANQPVSFPLYTSTSRGGESCGEVVEAESTTIASLPPLRTVLRFGRRLEARTVPVTLSVKLSEIGTLELWCSSKISDHRWRLEFSTREAGRSGEEAGHEAGSAELMIASERLAAGVAVIEKVFSTKGGEPVAMVRELEAALGAGKEAWPLDAIRRLWEALWKGAEGRLQSAAYEARWLNLCGFFLRPGYGHDMDEWRLRQLWPVLEEGPFFRRAIQNRAEWWNLWKRVAGGLNRMQQKRLADEVTPWLIPAGGKEGRKSGRKKRSRLGSCPAPQEIRETWQAIGACERLEPSLKQRLGDAVLADLARGRVSDQQLWALSRLGARAPLYGPLNCVVPARHAAGWVERALSLPVWPKPELVSFALVQVSRLVGDRERDLDEAVRERLGERIRDLPKGERAVRLLSEALPLSRDEQARLLDESLPTGLRTSQPV